MKIIISKEAELHFKTALLLMYGIKESLELKSDLPPEHSAESIKRRLLQTRQELLQVTKGIEGVNW